MEVISHSLREMIKEAQRLEHIRAGDPQSFFHPLRFMVNVVDEDRMEDSLQHGLDLIITFTLLTWRRQ